MAKASVVTDDVIAQKTLPTLLSNYKLENIFNADEVGLFYQCLPDTTCPFSGERCPGGKNRKVHTVGMPAAAATGEKLPVFMTDESKQSQCFKNIRQLPSQYRNQKNLYDWSTKQIFRGRLFQNFEVP